MASTSTSPANYIFVVVSFICAKGTFSKARYFIRTSLDNQELETTKVKPYDSALQWSTPVTLTVEEHKPISITLELYAIAKEAVFHFTKTSGPVCVGKAVVNWDGPSSEVVAPREVTFGDVVVSFNLQVLTRERLVKKDLDDASQSAKAVSRLSIPESVGLGGEILGNLQPAFDAAQPFLERFEAVVRLMDKVTKVHPYVNAAWVVLSAVPKIYIRELSQNKQIKELLESLDETYRFVLKDQNLQQLDSKNIQELIALLADHTRECAYFIQSYASKSHRARLIDTVFASPEKRIDDLFKRLEELQKKLTTLLTQAAAVGAKQSKDEITKGVAFVGKGLEDLSQKIDLNDIPYAGGVSYNNKKCCLPETRISLLQQIRDWVDCFDEEENEKVFLLTGVAGSGKSSIAHSICHHYYQLDRLGSAFFFNIRSPNPPGGELVFSTIARNLADTFPQYKASLAEVANTRRIRQTIQPAEQFRSFIVKPAEALAESEVLSVGPVLLVIDALDECPEESKEELIQTLVEDLPDLPAHFRVLVTSRPEDLQDLLEAEFVRHVDLSSIGPTEAEADIKLFIQKRLVKVARKLDDPRQKPHNKNWLEQLVTRSEGLFIWAETACKQILSPVSRTPSQALDNILQEGGSGIDDLYLLALRHALGEEEESRDPLSLIHFRSLMSRQVILKWPMSVNEINFMESFVDTDDNFPSDVSILVSHLGAVLGGTTNFNEPLTFLHTSFRDFLMDETRSGHFCINDNDGFTAAHYSLANTCAAVLATFFGLTEDGPREEDLTKMDNTNRRAIAYSSLVAKHLELSGRELDVDLATIDDKGMIKSLMKILPEGGPSEEKMDMFDGWNSLIKLRFDFAEFTAQLQASPPLGYSWAISPSDQNPFKFRSRSFHIAVSDSTWSTSVCCVVPLACFKWEGVRVGFLTPQNTVLVWSPSGSEYIGQPIQLGGDMAVQMTFDYSGDFLAALTTTGDLVFLKSSSGALVGRFHVGHLSVVPIFHLFYDDDNDVYNQVVFKCPGDEKWSVYGGNPAMLYPDISNIQNLSSNDTAPVITLMETFYRSDLL